jgi:hypothetical protein
LITSSAISRWVQWVMGRPDCSGASQAMATIAQTCSAVIPGALPERGASLRRSSSPSSAKGIGWKSAQRPRQRRTMSRPTRRAWAMAALHCPSAACRTIRARRTSCCEAECRRMKAWRAWHCSSDSSTVRGLGPRMIGSAGGNRMRVLGRSGKDYTAGSLTPGRTSSLFAGSGSCAERWRAGCQGLCSETAVGLAHSVRRSLGGDCFV